MLTSEFWANRTVLVTGHMGFKGAWLCSLLGRLGARTFGFGKDERTPLLYGELALGNHDSTVGDVNDTDAVAALLARSGASVLLHLAAQPIVLTSYKDPLGTFRDNVMGTASVLEAARHAPALEAVVVVTSDKVYRNNEWPWPYRETEPLGGHDPYSASKAAAEIVTHAMVASYFGTEGAPGVATARAGNVIGGGDWAEFRLLPDAARAFSAGRGLEIRNPEATRPWQHVLEPLAGYLHLAEALVRERSRIEFKAWNFGPPSEDAVPVREVADLFADEWGGGAGWAVPPRTGPVPKEAAFLAVDASLAKARLGWQPCWRMEQAVRRTARWYREFAAGVPAQTLVDRDIDDYLERMSTQGG